MTELLTREVVWNGPQIAIQEAKRQDGSSVFGFPGAVVLPGEKPSDIAKADLTRKLGIDFQSIDLGDAKIIENGEFTAVFYETRLQYDSAPRHAAARNMIKFWYMDELQIALQYNLFAPLSSKYMLENF